MRNPGTSGTTRYRPTRSTRGAQRSAIRPVQRDRSGIPKECLRRYRHEHAVMDALARIDHVRQDLHEANAELQRLLAQDPGWRKTVWDRFMADGGVSYREFDRWLTNVRAIHQPRMTTVRQLVQQRRHLRVLTGGV